MKFEYETKEDDRECVAYIDGAGELIMRNRCTGNVICMGPYGSTAYVSNCSPFNQSEATRKFYPGDKLTITF